MPTPVSEKAARTLRLLLGSTHPGIRPAMQAYGYAQKDEDEGWGLLRGVGYQAGSVAQPPAADTKKLHEIDVWENRWFPVVQATLSRRFPAVASRFFLNLSQMSGPEVVISVQLFLDRYDELADETKYGPEGSKAKELLTERGLTPGVVNEVRALMLGLRGEQQPQTPASIEQAKADAAKAEEALWAWYLEWSQVARVAVKSRAMLHLLGFLQGTHTAADDAAADDPTAPANGTTTAPAPATTGVAS
jgi:hypothetical protein